MSFTPAHDLRDEPTVKHGSLSSVEGQLLLPEPEHEALGPVKTLDWQRETDRRHGLGRPDGMDWSPIQEEAAVETKARAAQRQ